MSIFDRRKREGNLPDPGEGGGGSDEQLREAADAVVEADEEQNPIVPPLPVPLTRQVQRAVGARGITEPPWVVNPPATLPGYGTVVGIGGTADQDADFAIQTIRVDNLSRQWMYFPDVQVWVPPLWVGRVFRYNGSHRRKAYFETPAGMTAYSLSTSEVAVLTYYEEMLEEVDGEQLSSATISGVLGAVAISGDAGPAQTQAYSADALSQTLLGLITNARMQVWNSGTSVVDRVRGGSVAGTVGAVQITPIAASQTAFADGQAAMRAILGPAGDVIYHPVAPFGLAGASWSRVRTAAVFKSITSLAIAASSTAVVWTPAAGLKPRLMGFLINLASVSGANGQVTFYDNTTTGAVLGSTGWLVTPNSLVGSNPHSIRLDNGPIVATSSNVIRAWSSTGITICGMVFGTEE
ncbi:MAG: hypothetical protein HY323_08050 [Betaproteobacteria bacterium]|nr:hypothetical protein [Betaproteobacteria bacterium]